MRRCARYVRRARYPATTQERSWAVPGGAFTNCVKRKESTGLEPDVIAFKYYAPGVGQVLTIEGDVREELVSLSSK